MNKERISKWDNAKLILILLVVVGHVAEYYKSKSTLLLSTRFFIYAFHMPAFILLAGLFSKKIVDNYSLMKILKYPLLYLILKSLLYIANTISGKSPSFHLLYEEESPWFVLALFFMYLITMIVKKYPTYIVLTSSVLLSLVAGYTTQDTHFLVFLRIINFYPFFYIGYKLNKESLLEYSNKKIAKILAPLLLFLCLLLAFIYIEDLKPYMPLLSGQNPYSSLKYNANFGWVFRLILTIISLVLALCVITVAPSKKTPITVYGSRTLSIYMTHQFVMILVFEKLHLQKYARDIFPNTWPILFILFGVVLTFLCGNKYLHFLFNIKLKHN